VADKAALLDEIYAAYQAVPVLREVSEGKRLVRGAGLLDAPIAVVGEAPGAAEEQSGEPFVGPAGQELRQLFQVAELPWQFCYRANVLPWRPPGNRTPYPFETGASAPRLAKEITVISPLVVIAAGATAWRGLSGHKMAPYQEARGRWFPWASGTNGFSCDLLVIWHPSAILHESGHRRAEMRDETIAALRSVKDGERDYAA
jgi:uracil-DNA glycosylase